MSRLLASAALALAIAPAGAQRATVAPPVHATLRVAGDRVSFKSGEPIRLVLALTADTPGFSVDPTDPGEASDVLNIDPEDGVHRVEGVAGRDYFTSVPLSTEPVIVNLALNYWARFDRAGTYTVSMKTRRVMGTKETTGFAGRFEVRTNAVTFRIEPTTDDDELALLSAAVRNLELAIAMGSGDQAFEAQILAAEALAFLPGDAAAIEKYRWFTELSGRGIPGNARELLRRGFRMSRRPSVILAAVEADLQDVNRPVTSDLIQNAASLAVEVKYPGTRQSFGFSVPAPGAADLISIERDRYLAGARQSLEQRSGLVRLHSASTILQFLNGRTPPDVVRIIVDGFEQFTALDRVFLVGGQQWNAIRDVRLGPVLRRTLDEVEPGYRPSILSGLIDIAPALALEPLSADILDPARHIRAELVRKMPRSALSPLAPQLVAVIREMPGEPSRDAYKRASKMEVLGRIADGAVRDDVRQLYDALPPSASSGVRASLLRYLLEWDPEEGIRRARMVDPSGDAGYVLHLVASEGSLPALGSLLRDQLFDRDLSVVERSAALLAREESRENRDAIELRLFQWRLDRQARLANGDPLTEADGSFESGMVRALAQARGLKEPGPERDQLLSACLTGACRKAFSGW